ncbi:ATP-binding cassette domain-containing protein [Ramlibacter sp. XY19]|uniref:ABC transporter ATP-binding protein n=1 Tax=Ramlibacter paludis TaxID=2908000 RepID=UPI0023DBF11B|nr:oligopeptide/dipeptide ABC transporter ATP-binding protein [Ramlibacter paludis]MCG2593506.1 ATP-binding cassette domain-containing protein [Ramlibacter paludis]
MAAAPNTPLLRVDDLSVRFQVPEGEVNAVNGISFTLEKGQTFGIVGESGSGKSQTMLALMGLLSGNGRAGGHAWYQGEDLLALTPQKLNKIRGNRIAMIFQDPMTALNPYLTVERQMTEVLELHKGLTRRSARTLAIQTLESVSIPDAARRITMYPHEFSGGMRQRIMIAMALLCQPDLLIADEPTTALDVTVQAQTMQLMRDLQREYGTAIILITHDLGVVAGLCDQVMVMYGGRIMEEGSADNIFYHPTHPYTRGLLEAVPRLDQGGAPLVAIPGQPPNMLHLPKGCPFTERCEWVLPQCASQMPPLVPSGAVLRACHRDPADVIAFRPQVKEAA